MFWLYWLALIPSVSIRLTCFGSIDWFHWFVLTKHQNIATYEASFNSSSDRHSQLNLIYSWNLLSFFYQCFRINRQQDIQHSLSKPMVGQYNPHRLKIIYTPSTILLLRVFDRRCCKGIRLFTTAKDVGFPFCISNRTSIVILSNVKLGINKGQNL